jgi:hypothetical protein
MEPDRQQPASNAGREAAPRPTRFGRGKRPPLPRAPRFSRSAGSSKTGGQPTAAADAKATKSARAYEPSADAPAE